MEICRCAIAESNRHAFSRLHVTRSCNLTLSQGSFGSKSANYCLLRSSLIRPCQNPESFTGSASRTVAPSSLTLKRVFYPGRCCIHQPSKFRFKLGHFFLHFPRDTAITEVPLHARAQPRNVFGFRKIHLEKKPGFCCKWQQIMRSRFRQI